MDQSSIMEIIHIILIIAAINWGLVAHNGTDLVTMVAGAGDTEKYIKYAIAAAGVYAAYVKFSK